MEPKKLSILEQASRQWIEKDANDRARALYFGEFKPENTTDANTISNDKEIDLNDFRIIPASDEYLRNH